MNGPKQKLVSIDEVSVSKLSVEIKTISVGRRQMSMALFRQLPRDPLIDLANDELPLNGMPWGRVNYHWDGCCAHDKFGENEHIHVLWQKAGTLMQSAVHAINRFDDDEEELASAIDEYLTLCRIGALLCVLATKDVEIKIEGKNIQAGRWEVTEEPQTYGDLAALLRAFQSASAAPDVPMYISKDYRRKEIETQVGALGKRMSRKPPTTEDEAWNMRSMLHTQGMALRTAQEARLALYKRRYQELLGLEQLFISA